MRRLERHLFVLSHGAFAAQASLVKKGVSPFWSCQMPLLSKKSNCLTQQLLEKSEHTAVPGISQRQYVSLAASDSPPKPLSALASKSEKHCTKSYTRCTLVVIRGIIPLHYNKSSRYLSRHDQRSNPTKAVTLIKRTKNETKQYLQYRV